MGGAEARFEGAVTYRALVRYDAYGEMTGHQSRRSRCSTPTARRRAVLDPAPRPARLDGKRVHDGQGELQLSPEEAEAVRLALAATRRPLQ